jgi:PKD-like domain/CHU_C Type IX secretion signal domain
MRLLILSSSFFMLALAVHAQLPQACLGGSPAIDCAEACIFCNFDGYTGSTYGFPTGKATEFCGTLENVQWLGFIAGAEKATFTITPFNCAKGNGLQVALYNDCKAPPLACDKGKEKGSNQPVTIAVDMYKGSNYFLLIDGYAGDLCEFSVTVSPKEAVYEPPLGVVGAITGPDKLCPGATATYSVQPVSGAAAYIWTGPPGSKIDTMPLPLVAGREVKITLGDQSGQICVQAANSCEQNPPCTSSMNVTVLSDADRPQINMDTLSHLTCNGGPVSLKPEVSPAFAYQYQWRVDSIGKIVSGAATLRPKIYEKGYYTLLVTNDQNGCTSSMTTEVSDPDYPDSLLIDIRSISCFGKKDGELQLGQVFGGEGPFVYSIDGGPYYNTSLYRNLWPGLHLLHLVGSNGCPYDTVVRIPEPQELILALDFDKTILLGEEIQLWDPHIMVSDTSRIHQVFVKPPMLAPMLCDSCRYVPMHSFEYEMTIMDANGCTATDYRKVEVDRSSRIFAPNIIDPNAQDERNRNFGLMAGPDAERILSFQVFNRWGKMVYERQNYAPDDESATWDGMISGELAQPAVFAWRAQVLFKDGREEVFSGDVTVFR